MATEAEVRSDLAQFQDPGIVGKHELLHVP
jgi:hypothetical protein